MLKTNRLQEIRNILESEGEVQTSELSHRFGVSEMTIRRDIDLLSKEAAIIRTRGGAYLAPTSQQREPAYSFRIKEASDFKEKIAIKAAEIMSQARNVYLDSGTSTEGILRHIDNKHYIVITNGINIAQESVNHSHISTVLIGGDFRTNTLSTTGPTAEEQIKSFRYDVAFLGCNAVDEKGNIYVGTTLEVGAKKAVIANSVKSYVLADSSKFNSYSLTSYGNLKGIAGVITNDGISKELIERFAEIGINVIIAE